MTSKPAATQRTGPMPVDWARMARPQDDGYDTRTILHLLDAEPMPWHAGPADRTAPSLASSRDGLAVEVAVDDAPLLPPPRFVPLPGFPEPLAAAIELVRCWPAASAQWPRIVRRIQPFADAELIPSGAAADSRGLGSCSHNESARFGVIGLTVNSPVGAAQAIVHETAHHKLRAMGVDNEAAVRFVRNDPRDLFPSPVVGRPRPMTAVLHAHYSFLHVLQLDLFMIKAGPPEGRADVATLIGRNAPRIASTAATLRRFALLDEPGESFVGAMLEWTDAALAEAEALI